jgi:hypothetical protein
MSAEFSSMVHKDVELLLSGETAKAAWTYLGNFPKLFQELFTIERKTGQAFFRDPPKGYL